MSAIRRPRWYLLARLWWRYNRLAMADHLNVAAFLFVALALAGSLYYQGQ